MEITKIDVGVKDYFKTFPTEHCYYFYPHFNLDDKILLLDKYNRVLNYVVNNDFIMLRQHEKALISTGYMFTKIPENCILQAFSCVNQYLANHLEVIPQYFEPDILKENPLSVYIINKEVEQTILTKNMVLCCVSLNKMGG